MKSKKCYSNGGDLMKFSDNIRYYTLDNFYKEKFGCKIAKISLNCNFTCPNRDGTKGVGGCIYCSNEKSGEYAGNVNKDIVSQFNDIKKVMLKKWPSAKFIGYFQAGTNTYASTDTLKSFFEPLLKLDNVVGLSIATRPDSISEECLDYLTNLNQRTYLTIELGLQTIHDKTSKLINRCHTLEEFKTMVLKLRQRKINVVVHIINGLPYETKEMMLETIKYLNNLDIQGIKIHMLHILKNTRLASMYEKEKFPILTKEEYIDIVINQLELLRDDIVIHRITGDPKVSDLIEPQWLVKKFVVLNDILKEMKKRNTYQGKKITG